MADFIIGKNKVCTKLKKYLIATFEGINEYNPLIIILSRKHETVARIIYPDIDPYLDDLEYLGQPEHEKRVNQLP